METDYICRRLAEIEAECREIRKRIAARPLFRSVTPNGGRAKADPSLRKASKQKYRKSFKARYKERADKGVCTTCGREPATCGKLGASCHSKQLEYWRKRSADKSERRANRRRVA